MTSKPGRKKTDENHTMKLHLSENTLILYNKWEIQKLNTSFGTFKIEIHSIQKRDFSPKKKKKKSWIKSYGISESVFQSFLTRYIVT